MLSHRQYACGALLFVTTVSCGGDKTDTKQCKDLRAEFEAQKLVHKEAKAALSPAVDLALSALPVASDDSCEAKGLSWQHFTHLTPELIERGHLGDPFYLGDFNPGSMCGSVNPENTKNKLANLRSRVEESATGNRLFFVDVDRVGAKLLGADSFAPGNVKGRLLVWSNAEKKFVCTADSYAESGKSLHTIKGGVKSDQDLDDHLTRNAVRSGIPNLKKIDFDAKAAPNPDPAAVALDAGNETAAP